VGDNKPAFDPLGGTYSARNLNSAGSICVPIPRRFIPFLLAVINPLRYPDVWTGDLPDINLVTKQVEDFMVALIAGDRCAVATEPDTTIDVTEPSCAVAPGGFCFFGGDDMPCLDISSLLRIQDGVLYAKDACCEWIAIGTLEAQEQPPPAADVITLLPSGQELSACGRAFGVWTTVNETVKAIWDHKYDVPWSIIGNIKSAAPTNLTTLGLVDAIAQAVLVDVAFGGDDVENFLKLQEVLCRIESQFEATADPLSDDEWGAIKSAYTGFGDAIDLPIANLYLVTATLAIGRERLSTMAQMGASNADQDCECTGGLVQGETNPDANGWYLSANMADDVILVFDQLTWAVQLTTTTLEHDVYGSFLRLEVSTSGDTVKRMKTDQTISGYTPPNVDKELWSNTSDHLEALNPAIPIISTLTEAIRDSLAAQLGYIANHDGGGIGLNSTVIASPPAIAGESLGAALLSERPTKLGAGLEIKELRLVHNVNSPSHQV
jgi:hypothetical protein